MAERRKPFRGITDHDDLYWVDGVTKSYLDLIVGKDMGGTCPRGGDRCTHYTTREGHVKCIRHDRRFDGLVASLESELEAKDRALRLWEISYPCPCGAWFDDLSQRPHVPGCQIDAARSPSPS